MNIFVVDPDPRRAARALHDAHVSKMTLESAQMLSDCRHHFGLRARYRPCNVNHPCTRWIRETTGNYAWFVQHARALAREFERRRGKRHASTAVIEAYSEPPAGVPEGPRTPFAQCMPDEFKQPDAVLAYRDMYRETKLFDKRGRAVVWSREPAEWMLDKLQFDGVRWSA